MLGKTPVLRALTPSRHRPTNSHISHLGRFTFVLLAMMLAFGGLSINAQSVVYDAVQSPLASSYPSYGFQARSTREFGDYVNLAGTNRVLNDVTATMVTWTYSSAANGLGSPYCLANPTKCSLTGWKHNFTLNIYAIGPGTVGTRSVGPLLATVTQEKDIPWRAEPTGAPCTGTTWLGPDSVCYNGFGFNLTFDMSSLNVVLPSDVVVGIAYNTMSHGYTPMGIDGPYTSLNVGARPGPATVGSDDSTDRLFQNSTHGPFYGDGGAAGTGTFREDSGKSPNATIPFRITANPIFRYVDDDGMASATDCDAADAAFSTINAAIAAAGAGDVIKVCPGSYNEDVAANKAGLRIEGSGAAATTVSGPIGGGGGSTFQVTASNVEISGFTITRDGNNTTDWNNAGLNIAGIAIQGQAHTGSVIHDNIITGMRTAIDINDSNGHTVRNNVIDNNHTGMIMRNQTDNLVVVENFITNNRTVGVLFLDASGGTNSPVQTCANCTFSNNNISGNWYGEIVDRHSGGSIPAPGTTNLKNFKFNWFGSTSPVITTANSAESQ
jgi:hypothetical protein